MSASVEVCQSPAFKQHVPFVFLHLPKTSGSALTRALIEVLKPNRIVSPAFDRVLFGTFSAFDSLCPKVRQTIYAEDRPLPHNFDFLSGHVSFSGVWDAVAERQLFSILREPISRILSHWIFWRGLPSEQLVLWGEWASRLALARQSLVDFLANPDIACQFDNLYVRMLVWPHPLVPENDFIDASSDDTLIDAARDRLRSFDFLDLYEDPGLAPNLNAWLGRPIAYTEINVTPTLPAALQSALHQELTVEAFELLEKCTRLDRVLWSAVAEARLPGVDTAALRERTIWRSIARFSLLLGGAAA
jgi:hypothetical protein